MLWWASVLMFIGATGFNISNIAGVLYGDVPLDFSTSQEVKTLSCLDTAYMYSPFDRTAHSILLAWTTTGFDLIA